MNFTWRDHQEVTDDEDPGNPAVLLVQGYDAETIGRAVVHPVVEKL